MQRNLLKLRGTCWHDPQASHGKTQHARLVTPLSTIDVVIDAYNPRDATKKGPSLRQVLHVLCLGFWTSEISEFGQFGLMLIILECFGMFALLGCDQMQLRYLDSWVCDYRAWPRFPACHVPSLGLNLSLKAVLPSEQSLSIMPT